MRYFPVLFLLLLGCERNTSQIDRLVYESMRYGCVKTLVDHNINAPHSYCADIAREYRENNK